MKKLSEAPLIHPTAQVENSTLGRWTEIAERSRVAECELGDYSYMMQDCAAWCATIGKFSNIARGFITEHPILLLDEPTASLDARNRDVVVELIAAKKAAGVALLGIFHDQDVRDAVADRLIDVPAFPVGRIAA